MDLMNTLKGWIGGLTEIGLMLIALAIVAALLVGPQLPFFGNVTANIVALVKDLGANGLIGLIALGFILWLFSKRTIAIPTNACGCMPLANLSTLSATDVTHGPEPCPMSRCTRMIESTARKPSSTKAHKYRLALSRKSIMARP